MRKGISTPLVWAALIGTSLLGATAFFFMRSGGPNVNFEKDAKVPIVLLNVAVKAGSVHDPEGKLGLTNLLGELMLRGTKNRTKEKLDAELDRMGATLEVETRAESLIFRGAFLSREAEGFLALLEDILLNPTFPETELVRLRGEILSALDDELGRDPSLGARRFTDFLFNGHPYGKPVLGRRKDLESMTAGDVRSQYERLFRRSQLLFVGSGDADESEIHAFANRIAKPLPDGAGVSPVAPPKPVESRRLLVIDKPDRTQTQVYGGLIGIKMTDPDYWPLHVANYILGGGSFQSRLMQEIRVKRGWSYGAYSNFRFGTQPRSWAFSLAPASKDSAAALAETIRLIELIAKEGVTESEFEMARNGLINGAGFLTNTPQKRVENILLEETLNLPRGFLAETAERIRKVSRAQVNEALVRYLRSDRLQLAVLATAKELEPELRRAAGVDEGSVEIRSYKEEAR